MELYELFRFLQKGTLVKIQRIDCNVESMIYPMEHPVIQLARDCTVYGIQCNTTFTTGHPYLIVQVVNLKL